jgi:hypothetical protein
MQSKDDGQVVDKVPVIGVWWRIFGRQSAWRGVTRVDSRVSELSARLWLIQKQQDSKWCVAESRGASVDVF